jgi:hypothetical protein
MKGKNFSCNNIGQRKEKDFYPTPFSITQQILERETLPGTILEPSCGDGAIVGVLKKNGYTNIIAKDLQLGNDFLKEIEQYDTIITNPPFSLAQDFILKAKQIAKQKIVLLLPLSYLHGVKRYEEIYQDKEFPLRCIYVFTRYPMLGDPLREDGCYKTGMIVYAWFCWEKEYHGEPCIRWINNQKYIIKEKGHRVKEVKQETKDIFSLE